MLLQARWVFTNLVLNRVAVSSFTGNVFVAHIKLLCSQVVGEHLQQSVMRKLLTPVKGSKTWPQRWGDGTWRHVLVFKRRPTWTHLLRQDEPETNIKSQQHCGQFGLLLVCVLVFLGSPHCGDLTLFLCPFFDLLARLHNICLDDWPNQQLNRFWWSKVKKNTFFGPFLLNELT